MSFKFKLGDRVKVVPGARQYPHQLCFGKITDCVESDDKNYYKIKLSGKTDESSLDLVPEHWIVYD